MIGQNFMGDNMKPILFNTGMVRAILNGTKTVTRRVVKPQPEKGAHSPYECVGGRFAFRIGERACTNQYNPPYRPGDILYVREAWTQDGDVFRYKAGFYNQNRRWHPSIHMPREAARIFLRVKDVRVERLQEITPEQIDAEGCKEFGFSVETGELMPSSPCYFSIVWNNTIKKADRALYGWDANPWVWVIEFERISREEAEHE